MNGYGQILSQQNVEYHDYLLRKTSQNFSLRDKAYPIHKKITNLPLLLNKEVASIRQQHQTQKLRQTQSFQQLQTQQQIAFQQQQQQINSNNKQSIIGAGQDVYLLNYSTSVAAQQNNISLIKEKQTIKSSVHNKINKMVNQQQKMKNLLESMQTINVRKEKLNDIDNIISPSQQHMLESPSHYSNTKKGDLKISNGQNSNGNHSLNLKDPLIKHIMQKIYETTYRDEDYIEIQPRTKPRKQYIKQDKLDAGKQLRFLLHSTINQPQLNKLYRQFCKLKLKYQYQEKKNQKLMMMQQQQFIQSQSQQQHQQSQNGGIFSSVGGGAKNLVNMFKQNQNGGLDPKLYQQNQKFTDEQIINQLIKEQSYNVANILHINGEGIEQTQVKNELIRRYSRQSFMFPKQNVVNLLTEAELRKNSTINIRPSTVGNIELEFLNLESQQSKILKNKDLQQQSQEMPFKKNSITSSQQSPFGSQYISAAQQQEKYEQQQQHQQLSSSQILRKMSTFDISLQNPEQIKEILRTARQLYQILAPNIRSNNASPEQRALYASKQAQILTRKQTQAYADEIEKQYYLKKKYNQNESKQQYYNTQNSMTLQNENLSSQIKNQYQQQFEQQQQKKNNYNNSEYSLSINTNNNFYKQQQSSLSIQKISPQKQNSGFRKYKNIPTQQQKQNQQYNNNTSSSFLLTSTNPTPSKQNNKNRNQLNEYQVQIQQCKEQSQELQDLDVSQENQQEQQSYQDEKDNNEGEDDEEEIKDKYQNLNKQDEGLNNIALSSNNFLKNPLDDQKSFIRQRKIKRETTHFLKQSEFYDALISENIEESSAHHKTFLAATHTNTAKKDNNINEDYDDDIQTKKQLLSKVHKFYEFVTEQMTSQQQQTKDLDEEILSIQQQQKRDYQKLLLVQIPFTTISKTFDFFIKQRQFKMKFIDCLLTTLDDENKRKVMGRFEETQCIQQAMQEYELKH